MLAESRKVFIAVILTILLPVALTAGLSDRAFGTHNVGQVGYFTTNIGQFYPYGGQFEHTLEYPINSGHIAMYRQCLMIGQPVNVVSAADGRFEEFDAVGGFNAGDGVVAMSNDPTTWPDWGWPVTDSLGNPVILSQQDSYCVYSDSTNWRYSNNDETEMLMDLRVHQTIHSWGVPEADKFVILRFQLENRSDRALTDMYFNYYSDLDIGGNGNAEAEWADDCVGFDKDRELIYFYDSDNFSDEWQESNPFLSGVTFLKTPNGQGITDWHWIDVYVDEVAVNDAVWDSLSYYLMSSDTSWFHEHPDFNVSDYFHVGDNPIDGTHYDDPSTTRIMENGNLVGGPMVAYICNGPFDIPAGERVEFIVGVMVGDIEADLLAVTDSIWAYYEKDFNISVVPAPTLSASSGDGQVTLSWDADLDINYSSPVFPDTNDLAGYILYRTTDPTLKTWTVVDSIPMIYKSDTVLTDQMYTYTDTEVFNGFNTFYCLTAYLVNTVGRVEQSTLIRSVDAINETVNAVAIKPTSQAAVQKSDLDKISVVPNPFVVSARWDEARLGNSPFGEPVHNIAFTNLPRDCTIRIFTLDGDLVRTLRHSVSDGSGREEWNLLTSERRPVVSGVYFYHVESDLGDKVGRFAIIR